MENDEELKKLIKRNLALTQEIRDMVKSIKGYVIWQRVFGFLKLLIVLIPIVLGIIYLPPIIKQALSQYREILGFSDSPMDISVDDLKEALAPGMIDEKKKGN